MKPTDEIWKPVPGTNERYYASTLGRIWDCKRRRCLSICSHPRGYLGTTLAGKHRLVHAVIAEAFIGPIPAGFQINHKDGVKTNNVPSNLEIVTQLQNVRHAIDPAGPIRHRPGFTTRKLSDDDVAEIRRLRPQLGVVVLAKRYGINKGTVVHIYKGTRRGGRLASQLSEPGLGA